MIIDPAITFSLSLRMAEDTRVTVWHISLYISMLNLWHQGGFPPKIKVSRKILMTKAHFKSITTYHKCITELQDLGYINYWPTYDCFAGSLVEIVT